MRHLGIFLFLVGGFGLGFAISETLIKKPAPTPAAPTSGENSADRNAASNDPQTVESDPADNPTEVVTTPDEKSFQTIVNQLYSTTPDLNGQIDGMVYTELGHPLEGVEISVRSSRNSTSSVTPSRSSPAGDHVRHAFEVASRRTNRPTAISGSDGRFSLSRLDPERMYFLRSKKSGYTFSNMECRPGQFAELIGTSVLSVPVEVRLPSGELAEKANLTIESPNQHTSHRWSEKSPSLTLRPGSHQVYATTDSLRSPPLTITVTSGQSPQPVVFQLTARLGVKGTITPESATITIWTRPLGDQPPDDFLLKDGSRDRARQGSYSILDLAPGRYHIGVSRFREEIEQSKVIDISTGVEELDFALPEITNDQILIVQVADPAGNPVDDIDLQITRQTGNRSSSSSVHKENVRPGEIWAYVGRSFWEALDSGEVTAYVTVSSALLGTKKVEVTGSPLSIRFGSPATVTVRYPGYVGSGFEGSLRTYLQAPAGSGRDRVSRSTASPGERAPDGSVEVGPLEPGEYVVITAIENETVSEDPISLPSGHSTVSIQLPTLYELTLRVESTDVGRSINVMSRETTDFGGRHHEIPANADQVVIPNLPAGVYDIMLEEVGDVKIMSVDVRQNTAINFDPKPLNAIRVIITSTEGSFAQSGFEDGDLIVAVAGGEDFKNMMDLQVQLQSLATQTNAKVRVLRGSETLDLEFDATAMNSPDSTRMAGGKFAPATRPE